MPFNAIKCRYVDKKDIWKLADDIAKQHWHYGDIPVDIELITESKIGLDIEPVSGLHAVTSIDAYLKSDFTGIVIDNDRYNDERYDNRLRFSIAHELGHYFLHRYLYDTIQIETPQEYYEFISHFPDKEYSFFEYQANQFAGRILVPHTRLSDEVSKVMEKLKDADLLQLLQKDPLYVLEGVTPSLCKPFGVSEDVIKRRVEEEGLWPQES